MTTSMGRKTEELFVNNFQTTKMYILPPPLPNATVKRRTAKHNRIRALLIFSSDVNVVAGVSSLTAMALAHANAFIRAWEIDL